MKWAVLPAGAAVARAQAPAGFVRRNEFLMFGSDGAVRFVEKFVRETEGRRPAVVDVHTVLATDALRDAIARPPAGYRATTVHGGAALLSNGEVGTVITLSWLEGATMAVELYGVGDDVSEAVLREVAESVRVVPLPAARRLEVST